MQILQANQRPPNQSNSFRASTPLESREPHPCSINLVRLFGHNFSRFVSFFSSLSISRAFNWERFRGTNCFAVSRTLLPRGGSVMNGLARAIKMMMLLMCARLITPRDFPTSSHRERPENGKICEEVQRDFSRWLVQGIHHTAKPTIAVIDCLLWWYSPGRLELTHSSWLRRLNSGLKQLNEMIICQVLSYAGNDLKTLKKKDFCRCTAWSNFGNENIMSRLSS